MSLVVNAPFLKFYNVCYSTERPQLYIVLVDLKDPLLSKLWQKNIHATDKK